jgi:hypothetical protein
MLETKSADEQLASFMAEFLPEIGAQAEAILNIMRRRYPSALELVYDNYNALAIGFAPSEKTSEAIFSIALYPRWVSLFFLEGKGLRDPEKLLRGSGNVVRHVVLESPEMLHNPAVKALMLQAVERARVPFSASGAHRIIIKSIAAKQRPRRPETMDALAAKGAKKPRPTTSRPATRHPGTRPTKAPGTKMGRVPPRSA